VGGVRAAPSCGYAQPPAMTIGLFDRQAGSPVSDRGLLQRPVAPLRPGPPTHGSVLMKMTTSSRGRGGSGGIAVLKW
jgi:hypothetical protein